MSSDCSASIGYGIEIPSSLLASGDCEDLVDEDGLDLMFGGDCYSDSSKTFMVIGKSYISVYTWEGGSKKFEPSKLKVKNDWDRKLTDWAKRHKVSKPKIGWRLCVSI